MGRRPRRRPATAAPRSTSAGDGGRPRARAWSRRMRGSPAPGSSRASRAARARAMLAHERVVEEEEGLRGDDRLAAPGDDRAGVGAVEQPAEVGGRRARPGPDRHQVHGPPRHGQLREGGAASTGLQAAGHGEQAVADRLRIEPSAVHPPEQAILRVRGELGGLDAATLLVGRRQHDQPVHRLHRPARLARSGRPGSRAVRGARAGRRAGRSRWRCGPGPRRSGAPRSD